MQRQAGLWLSAQFSAKDVGIKASKKLDVSQGFYAVKTLWHVGNETEKKPPLLIINKASAGLICNWSAVLKVQHGLPENQDEKMEVVEVHDLKERLLSLMQGAGPYILHRL